MPLTDAEQDIIFQLEEENQFTFAIESTDEFGVYITNLYTLGGEFWLFDIPQSPPISQTSLNDANSYVGWYHIRNGGSKYELIIPTRTADEDYTGAPLLRPKQWFISNGHPEVWEFIKSQEEGVVISGCTNPNAVNYNPFATDDDGSCQIINNWLIGEIPPETLNNLFTEGGELYNPDNNLDYQGYYHIHGPSGLPSGVAAGDIMMGSRYWMDDDERPKGQPGNHLLQPYSVDRLLWNEDRGPSYDQFLSKMRWSQAFRTQFGKGDTRTLEGQNAQDINATSFVDPYRIHISSTKTNEREILIIDNVVTTPRVKKLMEETDYQFNELIPDPNYSPGIFGTKPILKADINTVDLGAPIDGSSAKFPKKNKSYSVVAASDVGPPETLDPGNAGA